MKIMGVKTDWDADYEREMENSYYDCIAWDDRTYFTGLDYKYWLTDDKFECFPVLLCLGLWWWMFYLSL